VRLAQGAGILLNGAPPLAARRSQRQRALDGICNLQMQPAAFATCSCKMQEL